jgi:hypothetical protein
MVFEKGEGEVVSLFSGKTFEILQEFAFLLDFATTGHRLFLLGRSEFIKRPSFLFLLRDFFKNLLMDLRHVGKPLLLLLLLLVEVVVVVLLLGVVVRVLLDEGSCAEVVCGRGGVPVVVGLLRVVVGRLEG